MWLEADVPRVDCDQHKVTVAQVPWARHDAGFTRAFEEQVVTRVAAEHGAVIDPLADLRRIGIDEIWLPQRPEIRLLAWACGVGCALVAPAALRTRVEITLSFGRCSPLWPGFVTYA